MALGDLVIKLSADIAQFQTDMGRATQQAQNFRDKMVSIGKQAAGIWAGWKIGSELQASFDRTVDQMSKFKAAAEQTGASVESLSSLFDALRPGGTTLEEITDLAGKMNRAMQAAREPTSKQAQAFKNLRVEVMDAKKNLLPVEQVLLATGQRMNQFADDSNKVATAQALLGKTGSTALSAIKDLGDAQLKAASVTSEMAVQADEFQRGLARANAQADQFRIAIISNVLPYLNKLIDQFEEGKKAAGGFWAALFQFGLTMPGTPEEKLRGLKEEAQALQKQMDALNAPRQYQQPSTLPADQLGPGNAPALNSMRRSQDAEIARGKKLQEQLDANTKKQQYYQTLLDRQADREKQIEALRNANKGPSLAGIDENAAKALADAQKLAKAQADAMARAIDRGLEQQQAVVQSRAQFLDQFFQQNLVSFREYYQQRLGIILEGTQAEVKAIDAQIAALQKQRAAPTTDPAERVKIDSQIADQIGKRAEAERKAAEAGSNAYLQLQDASKRYSDQVAQISVRLKQMQGDTVGASEIQTNLQFQDLWNRAVAEGDQAAQAMIVSTKLLSNQQTQLNALQEQFSSAQRDLSLAERELQIQRDLGMAGELETEKKLDEARRTAADRLKVIADAYERIAKATKNQGAAQNAQDLKLQAMETIKTDADTLEKRFRSIKTEALDSFFEVLITRSGNASDAFKTMVNSMVMQLERLAAQKFVDELLGNKSRVPTTLGAPSFWDAIWGASPSSTLPGRAAGGPTMAGRTYLVGEDGPELWRSNLAGNVTSNDDLAGLGGVSITQNIVVNGGASRAEIDQSTALAEQRIYANLYQRQKRGGWNPGGRS